MMNRLSTFTGCFRFVRSITDDVERLYTNYNRTAIITPPAIPLHKTDIEWVHSSHYEKIAAKIEDLEARAEDAEAKLAVAVDALTRIKNYCQSSPISQGEINARAWAEKALAKITVAT